MNRCMAFLALAITASCAPVGSMAGSDDAAPVDAATQMTPDAQSADPADAASTLPTYANVHAILSQSCSGYCHAGGTEVGASLVLAPEDGSPPAIVNQPSRQVTRLMLVAPGHPELSYLMNKLDATMHTLPECSGAGMPCGVPMPWRYGGTHATMSTTQRDLIRQWIALGAPIDG